MTFFQMCTVSSSFSNRCNMGDRLSHFPLFVTCLLIRKKHKEDEEEEEAEEEPRS